MTALLKYILEKNKDAKIVVTGYYPLVSENSKLDIYDKNIVIPGLKLYKDPLGEVGEALKFLSTFTTAPIAEKPVVSSLKVNSKAFYEASKESLQIAADNANDGGNRVVFVDPEFQSTEAYGTSDSSLGSFSLDVIASTGHPTAKGASKYADSIMETIKNKRSDWLPSDTTEETTSDLVETSPIDPLQSNTEGTTKTVNPSEIPNSL